jgi:predicted N-acetyltransferase YhbS
MTDLPLIIRHETDADADTIERLHERAFGPGRFARSAYRLREGVPHIPGLSYTALVGTLVVASIRMTPILIGEARGLLLGPLTVEPAFTRRGIGMALVRKAIEAARADGHRLVLLVGDEPFYGRAGFRRVKRGQLTLPGPVDPDRILVLELAEGAFDGVSGAVLQDRASATPGRAAAG